MRISKNITKLGKLQSLLHIPVLNSGSSDVSNVSNASCHISPFAVHSSKSTKSMTTPTRKYRYVRELPQRHSSTTCPQTALITEPSTRLRHLRPPYKTLQVDHGHLVRCANASTDRVRKIAAPKLRTLKGLPHYNIPVDFITASNNSQKFKTVVFCL